MAACHEWVQGAFTFCTRLFQTCFGIRTLTVLIILPAETTTPVMCRRGSRLAILRWLSKSKGRVYKENGLTMLAGVRKLGGVADIFWEARLGSRLKPEAAKQMFGGSRSGGSNHITSHLHSVAWVTRDEAELLKGSQMSSMDVELAIASSQTPHARQYRLIRIKSNPSAYHRVHTAKVWDISIMWFSCPLVASTAVAETPYHLEGNAMHTEPLENPSNYATFSTKRLRISQIKHVYCLVRSWSEA